MKSLIRGSHSKSVLDWKLREFLQSILTFCHVLHSVVQVLQPLNDILFTDNSLFQSKYSTDLKSKFLRLKLVQNSDDKCNFAKVKVVIIKKRYILNNLIISSFTGETKHKVPAGVEEEHRKNGSITSLSLYKLQGLIHVLLGE